MRNQPNEAIRELRNIIGRTQAEFAVMIGASKDTVVSWETGRNKLSIAFARRICLATGADGRALWLGVSVPMFDDPVTGPKVYTKEDFENYRKTEWGRSDEDGVRHHLKHCVDALEVLFRAAAKPDKGKIRYRLPGVIDSFIQWCEQTSEDFKLGPQIAEELKKRKFKCGFTQTYRAWRAMAKGDPVALKAVGFKDDKRKADTDNLRLELEVVPEWAPGRSMNKPKPAMMKAVWDGKEGSS
ncbi:MAG: helix-turn-helix transcriptional regulator [Limisphaerales bacterium]